MKEQRTRLLFIVIFFLILCYPLYGYLFDSAFTLSGVTAEAELIDVNLQSVMDGSFQSSLNTWIENHFPGRGMLIKLRSQLRYTFLNESANSNVVVGKDKYLFETAYIEHELSIRTVEENQMNDTISKLEQLQDLLNEEGKELYLFITPSKAYFCKDKIPYYYFSLAGDTRNDYQVFTEKLSDSDLLYFDGHAYIEQYDGPDLMAPVFYSTGIHWSFPWGYSAAKAFSEFITENSKWNLSTLELTVTETDEPNWPDADLYQSLNLLVKPLGIQYYTAKLSIIEEKDRPNVFMRGGSFMGQSLSGLISAGVFEKNIHFENNFYFTNQYSETSTLPSYTAYDEMEILREYISESNILILEVNEDNIGGLAFELVDYLLENPDYLKYPER